MMVNVGSINLIGMFGVGVNSDGFVVYSGDLNLVVLGQLIVIGQNVVGGNVLLMGVCVNFVGSQIVVNGNLLLNVMVGDVNLLNVMMSV